MRFLSDLDNQWRVEIPDDIWWSSYLSTSADHRKMIHEQMRLCQLTAREATQKIYKCDEIAAQQHNIPLRWNTPIIQRVSQGEVSRIIGTTTLCELVRATYMEPTDFDRDLFPPHLLKTFLAIEPERPGVFPADW